MKTGAKCKLLFLAILIGGGIAGCSEGPKAPRVQSISTTKLRAMATQDDAEAQCELGFRYKLGWDMPENAAEAAKWYRKAADRGNAEAQCSLGRMYVLGMGVPEDAAEAAKWCRKAADQGDAAAQYNLGVMYAKGEGVPKYAAWAIKWYRLAADQGHAGAQYNLGVMYNNGKGVPKDAAEAYKWFNLAAADEDSLAAKERETLEKMLSRAKIAEGQRRARVFMEEQAIANREAKRK